MTSRRHPLLIAWHYAVAALLVLLAIGPALWLLNVALQPVGSYGVGDITAPADYTLANFRAVLQSGLARPLLNSLIVTLIQTLLNVLLASLTAYPLARMTFRGRDLLFVTVLATLMIPEQVMLVPQFVTIVRLGLFDTLAAIILPGCVTGFGIYLCRQAFLAIPADLEEAARIDGAGALRIWWHVMLPLARPTLATLAVFSMIGAWSNLLWPLIVLQDERHDTLPVALDRLLSIFGDNIRLAYAGSVLALLPMVAVYLLMQKSLTRGLLSGAVKG
jgi:putative chitobiose transport system permease protein